ERIGTEPLRDLLAPSRRRRAQVAHVTAAERRQTGGLFRLDGLERGTKRREGMGRQPAFRGQLPRREGQPRRGGAVGPADADVAVAAERSFEEEGVAIDGLLLVEKTEDAEGRQQITGKLDGGRAAPKAGSAAGGC